MKIIINEKTKGEIQRYIDLPTEGDFKTCFGFKSIEGKLHAVMGWSSQFGIGNEKPILCNTEFPFPSQKKLTVQDCKNCTSPQNVKAGKVYTAEGFAGKVNPGESWESAAERIVKEENNRRIENMISAIEKMGGIVIKAQGE